ncbi:MAG: BACON domain-containing carbohydrate-binding protein [Blastocatellia bacterium]|nr:BACON domain-containing carbohydrate-binding protein [Blastocatellia bacterium]
MKRVDRWTGMRWGVSLFLLAGVILLGAHASASKRDRGASVARRSAPAAKPGRAKRRPARAARPAPVAPVRGEAEEIHSFDDGGLFSGLEMPDEHLLSQQTGKSAKRFDQPDEAIRHYLKARLPEGETELPVERYFAAMEEMRSMPRHSVALGRELPSLDQMASNPEQQKLGPWTPVGPGNIGGRTRAILIHPQEPSIMYAAGVAGGVWKSVNAGASWTPISDLIANIAVSAMAMDPKSPDILYAGTGEGFFNADGVRGAGIFRTTDAGNTWSRLAATETSDFRFVNDLAISPTDSRRIYAATGTGIWRSLDSGATWTKVRPVRSDDRLELGGCHDVAIRTDKRSDYLYVACGNLSQTTIYRNTDASATGTWEPVLSEAGMGRSAIAVAPSNQNRVYVIAASISGAYQHALHAFFRSDSAGDAGSWEATVRNTDPGNKLGRTILSIPPSATATDCRYGTSDNFTGQSWYDLAIAVDPLDDRRVWVGSVDLFRTDDGGANWGLAGYVYLGSNFALGRVHPDQHVIVFHPKYDGVANQQMFVGNDGGIFRTSNARAEVGTGATAACNPQTSKVEWTALNNNYAVTQFYHGTVMPDGKSYFGGTQDNGTVLGADAAGADQWRMILGADGGYSAIDAQRPDVLYASTQNGGVRKSTDGGQTFSIANLGVSEATFINPIAMDPSEPRRLYMGARGIIRTSDGATSWQNVTGPIANATLGAIAIAPTDANFLMAGFSDGTIVRTDRILNYVANSVLTPPGDAVARPRQGAVSWIAFEPNSRLVAYATYSTFNSANATGHVFKTIDGGATWTNIDGSGAGRVPDIPVHCIVVDPIDARKLYLGTDLGVFVSTDGGNAWSVENSGFANTVTETLAINVSNGEATMYAFTHGRGAYKVRIAERGACSYSLSATGQRIGAEGGDAVVEVRLNPEGSCSWKAESNVSWIALQPNAGGSANGSVGMKVQANSSLTPRSGTVAIAGRSFTITQEAQPDTVPPSIAITSPAGPPTTTTQPTINIGGTVSDNGRVASVTWRSSNGLTGNATTSPGAWSAPAVPLTAGANTITFLATDGGGNIASASMTIVSTPSSALVTVAGTGAGGVFRDNVPAVSSLVTRPWRFSFDGAGNMYIADDAGHRVRKVSPSGVITTVAGTGVAGFEGDGGPATAARLNFPSTVVVDASGNLHIADYSNNRIRKVTAATGVITTIVGDGNGRYAGDGGPAVSASLNGPESCAIGRDGNLYIADNQNNRVRRVTLGDGKIETIAGTGISGFSGDGGPANAAAVALPSDVAFDGAGDLYIAAAGNNRIRKVTMSDGRISTVAGSGAATYDGENRPATSAGLGNPFGVAVDAAGNLYLSDRTNNRIRRVNAADKTIVTIAGGGLTGFSPDGSGALGARLSLPTGVAVDPAGRAFFADSANGRIRTVLTTITADAVPPVIAIASPTSGSAYAAPSSPLAISGTAADATGVAVVRWANDRGGSGTALGTTNWSIPGVSLQPGVNNITVTAWDPTGNPASVSLAVTYQPQQVLLTLAGTGAPGNRGDDGPATAAELTTQRGIAVDRAGNVYVADTNNRRVRKIAPNGVITAFAGTGELGSSGDGGPAVGATFNAPTGLALDAAGNLYISDSNLNKVRKVGLDGKISTVAGSGRGFGGYNGDNLPATEAELRGPQGLALDAAGNLYIADQGNHRIRKVNAADGRITTIAGNGELGFGGDDGPATSARFSNPSGVAVDAAGNVFVADLGNLRIRRIGAADGRIQTIAGTGSPGYNGDGIAAKDAMLGLSFPSFLSVDPAGNLIIADRGNHRIRRIDFANGTISTIAGIGASGSFGDGGSPQGANLTLPAAAIVDAAGNLFISDSGNNRIRATTSVSGLKTVAAVSAASFLTAGELAADSIAVAFGTEIASTAQSTGGLPLPTALGGATARVRDNNGIERLAPLFFASPGQLNFLLPGGTSNGQAAITVTSARGETLTGSARIAPVAPGLFSANGDGKGVASALALRVRQNNQLAYEPIAQLDPATKRFASTPIDLGPDGERVILVLFGTGFRGHSGLANVAATLGGVAAPVSFAGLIPGLAGLDQANIEIPRALAGKGEVDLVLTVNGRPANVVRVNIK